MNYAGGDEITCMTKEVLKIYDFRCQHNSVIHNVTAIRTLRIIIEHVYVKSEFAHGPALVLSVQRIECNLSDVIVKI